MAKSGASSTLSLFARIARVAAREGLRGLAKRITEQWRKQFRFVYGYMLLYPLSPDLPVPEARADIHLRRVSVDDLNAFRTVAGMYAATEYGSAATPEVIARRVGAGEILYVGEVDGEIIATLWIQLEGEVSEFQRKILDLKSEEVYCRDVFVDAAMRGKRIYPAMKALSGREIARQYGKTKLIDWVRWKNTSSLNASRTLGELRIGRIGYVMILRRKLRFLIWHKPRRL